MIQERKEERESEGVGRKQMNGRRMEEEEEKTEELKHYH